MNSHRTSGTAGGGRNDRSTHVEPLEPRRLLSAGDLDLSYGTGGFADPPVLPGQSDSPNNSTRSVAVGPDDRTVVAGFARPYYHSEATLHLLRYTKDGHPDPTFGGGDGDITFPRFADDQFFGDDGEESVYDPAIRVLVRPDRKVVLVVTTRTADSEHLPAVVYRFNPDGTPDATFGGGDGVVESPMDSATVALAPDGKLVMAGYATTATGAPGYAVTRLTAGGTVDRSFGTNGVAVLALPASEPRSNPSLAVRADGKVVLLGTAARDGFDPETGWELSDLAVFRLTAAGKPDATFGTGGVAVLDLQPVDTAECLSLLPDGRLLVAETGSPTSTDGTVRLVRLTPAGTRETTFEPAPLFRSSSVQAIAADAAGRAYAFVFGGYDDNSTYPPDTTRAPVLVRFDAAGKIDRSFATAGVLYGVGSFGGLQSDGKPVTVGDGTDVDVAFAPVRYLAAGGPPVVPVVRSADGTTLTVTGTPLSEGITVTGLPADVQKKLPARLRVTGYRYDVTVPAAGLTRVVVDARGGNDGVAVSAFNLRAT
ncbi:MAG TPA: hypothetical protein VF796_14530, partial [Humisphaera sp.]